MLLLPGKVQCAKCDCHLLRSSAPFPYFALFSCNFSPVPDAPWGVLISVSFLLHFIPFSPLGSSRSSGERNAKYIFSFLIDARSSHKNNAINDNPSEASCISGSTFVRCFDNVLFIVVGQREVGRSPGICAGMMANIGIACREKGGQEGEDSTLNREIAFRCFVTWQKLWRKLVRL